MARPRTYKPTELADRTLETFWTQGFHATSMDDLVRATGVSRHGFYQTYGDKRGAFLAAFGHYRETVVDPAFAQVEREGATLADVEAYFDRQIALAEAGGLPGPGCLVANAATETAPGDTEVQAQVTAHNDRLRTGFAKALRGSATAPLSDEDATALAETLLTFATGLWSLSRVTDDGDQLRRAARTFLKTLSRSLP